MGASRSTVGLRRTLSASPLEPGNSGRPLQVDGGLLGAADRGCHADHRGGWHRERGAGTSLAKYRPCMKSLVTWSDEPIGTLRRRAVPRSTGADDAIDAGDSTSWNGVEASSDQRPCGVRREQKHV